MVLSLPCAGLATRPAGALRALALLLAASHYRAQQYEQLSVSCGVAVDSWGCDGLVTPLAGGAGAGARVRDACAAECVSADGCQPGAALNASTGACESCAPGRFSRAGNACEDCAPGKHQDNAGASYCYDCPVGRFGERPGLAECATCPGNSSTCSLLKTPFGTRADCLSGATSAAQCTCSEGFLPGPSGVCEPCPFGGVCCLCKETAGCFDPLYGPCDLERLFYNFEQYESPCPTGGCVSGSLRALPKPGYEREGEVRAWRVGNSTAEQATIVACNTQAAGQYLDTQQNDFDKQNCRGGPNNTCAPGHYGLHCSLCRHNGDDDTWFLTRFGHCDLCADPARSRFVVVTIGVIVIFLAAPLGWGLLYWMVADKESANYLVYFRLLVDHFQLLSINTGIRTSWPWELQSIYHATEGSTFQVLLQWIEMECAFDWDYSMKYYIFLMLPVFFFSEVILITGMIKLICIYRIDQVDAYVAEKETDGPPSAEQLKDASAAFEELDPEMDGWVTVERVPALGKMCGMWSGRFEPSAIAVRNAMRWLDPAETGRVTQSAWLRFLGKDHSKVEQSLLRKLTRFETFAIWVCHFAAELNKKTEGAIPTVPETKPEWEKVKDHAIQILLMLMMVCYITLAKWGISVFDCFEQPNQPGRFFLDDAPYIECFSAQWYSLSAIGGFAVAMYVIGLPLLVTYIFARNLVRVRMGDMQCMQRYGFLYKPYKPNAPFWEVVILVRKSMLVLVTKLKSQSPYMQGVWSLLIYAVVLVMQSRFAPYRQARHTNMANYFVAVNAFAVFSSLIFTSTFLSEQQQTVLLHVNFGVMFFGWGYALYETAIDLYLYLRLGKYVQFALGENQVDPNVDQHYQAVDPNGVVNLGYYDLLVLRARYSHTLQRTVVLPDAGPASGGKGSAGEGSPKVSTTIIENQTRAHERFANFNSQFAEFVRRVDPSMVLARELVGDGADDDDALKNPLRSPIMLTECKNQAKMLEELYSKELLALMVVYYDYIIKNDLVDELGTTEYGAPELAEDVIHFINTFTNDAILQAGGLAWGRTKEDHDTLRSSHVTPSGISVSPDRSAAGSPVSMEDGEEGQGGDPAFETPSIEVQVGADGEVQVPDGVKVTRTLASMNQEVAIVQALSKGRRWLLNPNKLLGNNLRPFFETQKVDWLSLDDVLGVLTEKIEKDILNAAKMLAKDPSAAVLKSPAPGDDDRAPWKGQEIRIKEALEQTDSFHQLEMLGQQTVRTSRYLSQYLEPEAEPEPEAGGGARRTLDYKDDKKKGKKKGKKKAGKKEAVSFETANPLAAAMDSPDPSPRASGVGEGTDESEQKKDTTESAE